MAPPALQVALGRGGIRWIHHSHPWDEAVVRIDSSGAPLASVRRTPGNLWFAGILRCEVDSGGNLVVLVPSPECVVAVYSSDGKPLEEFHLPEGYRLSVGPRWIAVWSSSTYLVRREDGRVFRCEPRGEIVGLSPDGRELLTLEAEGSRLLAYSLP